ncbi:hypothetical protein M408DRAFT_256643 [Serendipita vermifera MAFF 305830]|uniref:Uncharacterized protein n=1 Tax=Serendipita vermifera MAFF 305830 TaxID=933852 RepID=A0A0C3BIE7_SERVB|nr:hypothetical protein M408DRAFT_256643 [Serendipita vermifera MAFF 305830]
MPGRYIYPPPASVSDPTESGFSQNPEDHDRENKAIMIEDRLQNVVFHAIQNINAGALRPFGPLSEERDPQTRRYRWLRRTPEGIIPEVWCRKSESGCDVTFDVVLYGRQHVNVHVPIDSWRNHTCDSEAVRAAIQQAYLNFTRGTRSNPVVVKPGLSSLQLRPKVQRRRSHGYDQSTSAPIYHSTRHQGHSYSVLRSPPLASPRHWTPQPSARDLYPPSLHTSTALQNHNYVTTQTLYLPYPSSSSSGASPYLDVPRSPLYPGLTASPSTSISSSRTLVATDPTYSPVSYTSPLPPSQAMYDGRAYVGPTPPRAAEMHVSALYSKPRPRRFSTNLPASGPPRPARRNSGWSRLWAWV